MLEPEPLSQPQPEPEPPSQPEPPPEDEPLPGAAAARAELLPDQLPPEPDIFERSRSRSSSPPEDQPELPERLMVIVQLPPPQLELPLIVPPLDHFEPLSMFQDQPPMRPFQDQRPEFQPIGQPCFIQWP